MLVASVAGGEHRTQRRGAAVVQIRGRIVDPEQRGGVELRALVSRGSMPVPTSCSRPSVKAPPLWQLPHPAAVKSCRPRSAIGESEPSASRSGLAGKLAKPRNAARSEISSSLIPLPPCTSMIVFWKSDRSTRSPDQWKGAESTSPRISGVLRGPSSNGHVRPSLPLPGGSWRSSPTGRAPARGGRH